MAYRGRIDDPGVMEGILDDIRTGPIEYWLDLLAKYEEEKPGDVVLPGVPPQARDSAAEPRRPQHAKKRPGAHRAAA